MTLSAFVKQFESTEGEKTGLIYQVFDSYCEANHVKFTNETEKAKAKRMFWVGFMICQKMNEFSPEIDIKVKDPHYNFSFTRALQVWRMIVDPKRYDYFEFKEFCKRIGIT